MTKTMAVFRFELGYQLRRASTLLYFAILFAISIALLQTIAGGPRDDGNFNSPFSVTMVVMFGSMLALLMMAGVAGDAAARDTGTRMDSLFYSSPVGKRAYVFGRFLGAFVVSALLVLALPAGCLLASSAPWIAPERLGPTHASAYVTPYLLFALPNAFIGTAFLFTLAALTRRAMASYGGAAFLFFAAVICQKLLPPRLGCERAKLLDPLGMTTIQELMRSLTPLQKNTFVLTADGALLASRVLWIALALITVAFTYARFRLAHAPAGNAMRKRLAANESEELRGTPRNPEEPAAGRTRTPRRVFDAATRLRQLVAITTRSFAELHASRAWWIVPFVALLFVIAAPELAKLEMGIPGPLTTARLLDYLTGDVSILFTLLIALSAGELVWRERDARMHPLAGVTPVPEWVSVTGKFLGLAAMLAATLLIFFAAGVAVQTMVGTEHYELALYVEVLFGLQLPEYLLIAALAMIVHVLVNQKYVAHLLIVLTPFATDLAGRLGVEDNLLLYGSLPRWAYSEMSHFGTSLEARLWFTLYFGGWAVVFAVATYLFWIRGEERGVRPRMTLARRRLSAGAATVGAIGIAIIAGAGGFIFYSTHVREEFRTTADIDRQRAEFEQRYGRYASLPQPVATAAKLHVDFHPSRGTATIRGTYRLENRTGAAMDGIHVATAPGAKATTISFDRAARAALIDDDRHYRIYALSRALAPGESMQMNFQIAIESSPFGRYGTPPVVENGSLLIHRPKNNDHWLPLIGYQPARELDDPALRKQYKLRERPPYPRLGDIAVGNEQKGYGTIALETIVSTDAGQLGVAPGELRRTWTSNGRQYAYYVTDAPITDAWTIASADYAVHRARWRNVTIEIFHHRAHTANLERMVASARASLDYNTRHFGPYPHRQLRFVERPSDSFWLGMTAHSGLVVYQEGFHLVRPQDDPRKIDFPFAVVAHEVGHQWWGHQLTPATIAGAPFLAESLAWYSGMLTVEETYGREHLQRILTMMREQYLSPNQPRTVPLLRTVNQLDAYRTGPFSMYALRETVGVEPVNAALRNLLAKFPPGRPPYPTTLDFYAELRAATPPATHALLKDLFEDITWWDLRATRLDVHATGTGAWRATLHVDATKRKGDAAGNERPVPMNDAIEIVLHDAAGKPLYRERQIIRSGAQSIDLVVPRPPARAEVDPDRELLEMDSEDNAVTATGASR